MRCLIVAAALLASVPATAKVQSAPPLLAAPYLLGSSVYSVRDFAPEISAGIGRPVSATSLEALGAAIRARYVRDGYISPVITIPSEDVGSATPRLYVFEARIVDVLIKGDPGPYGPRITAYVRTVRDSPTLRKEPLRQALRRIAALPGLTSRPVFDPLPGGLNEFLMVLNTSYRPLAVELNTSNSGTGELGRVLYAGSVALNGLLGAGERIQVQAASSSLSGRYRYADVKVSRGFGAAELYVDSAGSEAAPDPDIRFSDRNTTLGIRRGVARIAGGSLTLRAAVRADASVIRDSSNFHLVDDRIRSFTIGLGFEVFRPVSQTSLYATVDQGVHAWNASSLDADESGVDVGFTRYLFGVTHSVALSPLWRVRLNLDAQQSSATLPVVERFAFGGLGWGAAFDPASLVGDSGAAVSAELGRSLRPWMKAKYATLFARVDYGIAWNNAPYLPSRDDAASLSSGLLVGWPYVSSSFELSTPLHQPAHAPAADSLRGLFSITVDFF